MFGVPVDDHTAPGPEPAGLAAWLRGAWVVTRMINGGAGHFEGSARFAPDPAAPAVTIWEEHGRLRFAGHEGPAARTLRIEAAGGGGWMVRFADDRPFHSLDLSSGSAEVTHHCGEDVYRGRYEIEDAERFTVTWRVTGPHKDDVIASVYDRAAGARDERRGG